jgi:hypothetical protein
MVVDTNQQEPGAARINFNLDPAIAKVLRGRNGFRLGTKAKRPALGGVTPQITSFVNRRAKESTNGVGLSSY